MSEGFDVEKYQYFMITIDPRDGYTYACICAILEYPFATYLMSRSQLAFTDPRHDFEELELTLAEILWRMRRAGSADRRGERNDPSWIGNAL